MKLRPFILSVVLALGVVLLYTTFALTPPPPELPSRVAGALEAAELKHPVTAVLLSFRAYDTLLEVSVLLTALLAAPLLAGAAAPRERGVERGAQDALARALAPVGLLIGGYLLWAGGSRAGGAFQAGAVLAGVLTMLQLSGWLAPRLKRRRWRLALALGPVAFLVMGTVHALSGGWWLGYPSGLAYAFVFAIEAALAVSIALTLFALFAFGAAIDEGIRHERT